MYRHGLEQIAESLHWGRGEVGVFLRTCVSSRNARAARKTALVAFAIALCTASAGTGLALDVRIIDRYAGGSNGDGGPATGATLNPIGTAVDAAGNIFIADSTNHRVRRVDAVTGFVSSVAGTGVAGSSGDGGLAIEAILNNPVDVEVDLAGNLYIADRGNSRVRRIDAVTGIIDNFAGTGVSGFSGDNGFAVDAEFRNPGGLAYDAGQPTDPFDDILYITDTSNNRIRKVTLSGGGISTYAGNGEFGFSGDGSPAINASLALPADVTVHPSGDLYIADFANQRVRVVRKDTQKIFTAAGSGQFAFCDDVVPSEACFRNPIALEYDAFDDAVLVADAANQRIRHIPLGGGNVTTIAGTLFHGYNGDGIPATTAYLDGPVGVSVHPSLGIFISDQNNYRVRLVERGATPLIFTVAGNGNLPYAGDGGPALAAKFSNPSGITTDGNDNLFVADTTNNRVRQIDASGMITTLAGTGEAGFSGDNGNALSAKLSAPADVATDNAGNVYISDKQNNRVRRVAPSGTITTVLGNGQSQSSGDGGNATSASTHQPSSLALYENTSGTQRFLYVVESAKHKVRVVNLNTNKVNRFAGTGTFGFSGDGGPAASAKLGVPQGIAADDNGNVYISDTGNQRIRRVSASGTITTIAGNGSFGFDGDGGLAISAKLASPSALTVGPMGTLLIVDIGNKRVRAIDSTGIIQTITGTGFQTGRIDGEGGNPADDLGDLGPSTEASFSTLSSVTFDSLGNGYVSDVEAETIRWIDDLSSLFGSNPPQGAVSGDVRYAGSFVAVPAVNVQAFGPSNESATTTANGSYDLSSMETAPWLIEPVKQGGFGSGIISALDASFVLQEVVGLRTFTSAQSLACDVTGDGDISPLDATRILQRALGGSTPFPAAANCGSDWLFEPNASSAQNQTQIQPLLQGGTTCRRGGIQFNPLTGQPDGQDFTAIVVGDCTANWNGSGGAATSALTFGQAAVTTARIGPERASRRRVRVPISIDGATGFNALEMHIGFDPSAVRPMRVRGTRATRRAMIGWQENGPGEMTIVLAAGQTIAAPARNAVVIDFEIIGKVRRSAVRSARVQIDDADARIRVTRGSRRR